MGQSDFGWNLSSSMYCQSRWHTHSKRGVPLSMNNPTSSFQTGGPPYQIPKMLTQNEGWGTTDTHSKRGV